MTKPLCPVIHLDLGEVSGFLYKTLEWLANHGMLGCNPEEVALFILTKDLDDRLRSGQFEKDDKFARWLDREMAAFRKPRS
jgi:hypothetical protein